MSFDHSHATTGRNFGTVNSVSQGHGLVKLLRWCGDALHQGRRFRPGIGSEVKNPGQIACNARRHSPPILPEVSVR